MFENIITEEKINFNEIEVKVYKYVCNMGCKIIREILESIDIELMNRRDKNKLRNKGKRKNCVKTIMGEVEYERRVYEIEENKKVKCKYLLEDFMKIFSTGKVSENLMEKVLNTVVQTTSYRKAEKELEEISGIRLSHEALRNITNYAGEEINKQEKEIIKLKKEKKLKKGKREIPILFEEADGLWINLQGKDRKEQIERNKKENEKQGKKYIPKKRVKAELKLHESYEGWKKDSKRHEIVNKTYIAGFMTTNEIIKLREAKIYNKYNEEKIQYRVINGDGALWINKLGGKNIIRQKDRFHIHREITRKIEDKAEQEKVKEMFERKEYKKIDGYLEELKYKLGGEEKIVKKLESLQTYMKKDLERYTDVIEKLPESPKGIEYRTLGTMESQIYTVLSKRLKGRKSFSKKGATNLAKVCARYKEKQGKVDLKGLEKEIKIDEEKVKEEEYIKELEKRYRENYEANITSPKNKDGIEEEHTIRNINVSEFQRDVVKNVKNMIRYEKNSEMTSWATFFTAYKGYKNRKYI